MRFGLLLAGLIVFGCFSKTPTGPSSFFFFVTLSPGQTAAVPDTPFSIKFHGVSGDSRCPINATCITGGDALVKIEVIPTFGGGRSYDLHTGTMEPVRHDNLVIELVDLTPYPFAGQPTDPADYRVKLRVTR